MTEDLADLMRRCGIPGVSIATDSGVECHGVTVAGGDVAVEPRTVFQACSISKHVAAYGILRLVDRGDLDLDGDAGGLVPVAVTVRQLLAHTAGLSYNWFRGYEVGAPVPTLAQVLRGEPPANTPPVRPDLLPGSRFRYSGSHYAVLQQIVTDVTGDRFDDVMRDLVLDPLGMADSSYDQDFPASRPDLVAHGHHSDGVPVRGGWRVIPEAAGAGLWTTPSDLVQVEREIMRAAAGESALLGADLANQMLTPQVPGGYGLGTAVDAGGLVFGHDGGNVGYNCVLRAWTGSGAVVAAMVNADGAGEVLQAVLADAEARYRRPAGADTAVTGVYEVRPDYPVGIDLAGETLTLTVPGQPPLPLEPVAPGRYRVVGLNVYVSFSPDGLEIHQGGTTQTATRRDHALRGRQPLQ